MPIALETLGAIAAESLKFLSEVDRRVPLIVIIVQTVQTDHTENADFH